MARLILGILLGMVLGVSGGAIAQFGNPQFDQRHWNNQEQVYRQRLEHHRQQLRPSPCP